MVSVDGDLAGAVNGGKVFRQRAGELPSRIGEHHFWPLTGKQLAVKPGLKRADMAADRPGGNVQRRSGFAKGAKAGGGFKSAEGIQRRHRHIGQLSILS